MRNRKNSGFTMAELLLVIAILTVLFGVVAVNVVDQQRAQTRLEFDSIAKEIFVAAQNHLTLAESQGYPGLGTGDFGTDKLEDYFTFYPEDADEFIKDVYLVTSEDSASGILGQMLPDYALDGTVQAGGTYLIFYQLHPAKVLDVFYSKPGQSSFLGATGTDLNASFFTTLMEGYRDTKDAGGNAVSRAEQRERFPKDGKSYVIGWYGGGKAVPQGERLDVPTVEIHNEEQLYVKVTDPNAGKKLSNGNLIATIKLVVEGKASGAKAFYTLEASAFPTETKRWIEDASDAEKNVYSVLLDDVTSEVHFANIGTWADMNGTFLPGEDISIYAVAFSTSTLTNIAMSPEQSTNSLFGDGSKFEKDKAEAEAEIVNFRHLENMEEDVSDFDFDQLMLSLSNSAAKLSAAQKSDLDWTEEWTDWTGDETHKRSWEEISLLADPDHPLAGFCPVSPDYTLVYSGREDNEDPAKVIDHSVSRVTVSVSDSAGLFGELGTGSTVSDLELIDFTVTSASGDAGALIGTAEGVEVTNVPAHNSAPGDTYKITGAANAGGLIGSLSGGSVTDCAAALYVDGGSGNAGGLIGSVSDSATVKNSYAGGHTHDGKYEDHTDGTVVVHGKGNVTGATAGGLIGELSGGTVTDCYSTCSADGASFAGGLIGTNGGSVKNCYATGLVCKNGAAPTETDVNFHALVGSGTADDTNCYLGIINPGMAPDSAQEPAAKNISKNLANYAEIYTNSGVTAYPYDDTLGTAYPMKPSGASGFAAEHYGDWPRAETAVVNTISA